ncbi:CDP-glycerol glycerophosphotransferase family protein [Paenibacillus sp. PSB04]|uniref:CDP-glycerol glycerophosphotransferase family protein n=1 Tax=Paenibacillus sp. PSB04 TaxID=2866810 RepID=UPI0021F144FD|nr:CDP-glycerol glycerophosphotransferase family protein [Paenibacillus sp. PSB04]UYO05193.1 CDP-glycerol glycerophosphotransferase family protein [Paenibacillus sp. PSB04]
MTTDSKIKITMFHLSSSGSNNYYLYRAASEDLLNKYDIELLSEEQFRYHRNIDQSDVYITTHGEYSCDYEKINIDLWHGFPLKGMAKMDKQEQAPDEHVHQHWSKVDMIMSYSALYNTAMNACNGANISQYRITGVPRNDALFVDGAKDRLQSIFPELNTENDNIVFFMPTFRKSVMTPGKLEGAKEAGNVFGFSEFDKQQFTAFLDENQITLVLKLHPFEESFFSEELSNMSSQRILILNDDLLKQNEMDLYDVLGAADMLITDYSSVYIDFLLLDRPVMFLPVDLDQYKGNRGLLLEPYDFWTPGPKANSQSELQQVISQMIQDPIWYQAERERIKDICHHYQDNRASERIWDLIDSYIEEQRDLILERRRIQQEHKQLQHQVKKAIQGMIERNQLAQANEAIEHYLQSNLPDQDIFAMNGMLHLLNGDPREAILSFKKGYQHFPWDEDLVYNLGYVHEIIGEAEAARAYYQKALQMTGKPELQSLIIQRLSAIKG